MMRICKKFLSIILVLVLICIQINSVYANSPTNFETYISRLNLPTEVKSEKVNGSVFTYFVENKEATIVHVLTNYTASDNGVFTFPVSLGGYPVTSLGYDGNRSVAVFEYHNNGEDLSVLYPELGGSEPESDPGLRYITEVVIPEGYEKVCKYSLQTFYGKEFAIKFPKSLKTISTLPVETLFTHINENNEKYTVLPECQYPEGNYSEIFRVGTRAYSPLYFPSRYSSGLSGVLQNFYSGEIYLPSNFSSDIIKDVLFVYGPHPDYEDVWLGDVWQGDEDEYYGKYTTIHCSPDSEFLEVFKEITCLNYYTIITDVIPAEYIEFPEKTVNVHVGEIMDLEAKTYPTEAIWTACDYTVSDPSIVKIDEYSGRITALKEGTVTVTATHCERGYVDTCTVNVTTKPEPGVNGIEPATDTTYVSYGNRDYKVNVTGSPSKIQVVRDNGGTTTIDRRKATVTSNGDTETWIVNMRVEAGTHNIRAKYGKVWDDKLTPFTVKYDLPGAYSFDLTYENGIGNFNVVTDPEVIKIQFALSNGCTLTYSQTNSYIGEDGLRHWEISRKLPSDTQYTLKTKYGYTWTTTELAVTT